MLDFLLATTNNHKALEFNELLKETNLNFKSAQEKIDVIEDGESFNENAFKKANAYYDHFRVPTVADDSGIVVSALPDQLGVHSARFCPDLPDYKEKNQKLIELLKDKEDKDAYFVCVLCFYLNPDEIFFFEGRVHGTIGHEIKGDRGFGYDPIFLPSGQGGLSMAQLPDWKNENSHRAKALKEAVNFFKNKK